MRADPEGEMDRLRRQLGLGGPPCLVMRARGSGKCLRGGDRGFPKLVARGRFFARQPKPLPESTHSPWRLLQRSARHSPPPSHATKFLRFPTGLQLSNERAAVANGRRLSASLGILSAILPPVRPLSGNYTLFATAKLAALQPTR
ncbi:hypothetical protein HPB48_014098 [Haemaphysalis longicornis]|uniref:Uncharacterized protein n=1 Tax=Haemaphysalis longicornis TaxID=44386 RepID=A0A9J6FKZ1_HAELO|nr:hypothetical protein HPB48_014098 [Haemaphysalis longicornis]